MTVDRVNVGNKMNFNETKIGETTLYNGDCIEVMDDMIERGAQIDSIVTDPLYHLTSIVKRFGRTSQGDSNKTGERVRSGADSMARFSRGFMGQTWDGGDIAFNPETWRRCYDLLKPGGYLLAFSGSRTYHRMACAIEDAGFEIRDQIMWLYGTGFPKSQNVERFIAVKTCTLPGRHFASTLPDEDKREDGDHVCPVTPESEPWTGYGNSLKPAHEPIVMARKPLIGTVAENVLTHGTGAINIDACRVPTSDKLGGGGGEKAETAGKFSNEGWRRPWMDDPDASEAFAEKVRANVTKSETLGRFPANAIHDGSEEVLDAFAAFGVSESSDRPRHNRADDDANVKFTSSPGGMRVSHGHNDSGTAARFFYSAKANKKDRAGSKHPTVKPISLIEYLCKLVTRPGGVVLDPFAGSGTLGSAWPNSILIEREEEYFQDIVNRLQNSPDEPETPVETDEHGKVKFKKTKSNRS